jgi:hypothetical protein
MNEILMNVLGGAGTIAVTVLTIVAKSALNGWKAKLDNDHALTKVVNAINTDELIDNMAKNAVKFAEEQAFKAWKSDDAKEMTNGEKKDIAISHMEEKMKMHGFENAGKDALGKAVESAVAEMRDELDSHFDLAKTKVVEKIGRIPNDSTFPIKINLFESDN